MLIKLQALIGAWIQLIRRKQAFMCENIAIKQDIFPAGLSLCFCIPWIDLRFLGEFCTTLSSLSHPQWTMSLWFTLACPSIIQMSPQENEFAHNKGCWALVVRCKSIYIEIDFVSFLHWALQSLNLTSSSPRHLPTRQFEVWAFIWKWCVCPFPRIRWFAHS